MNKKNNEDFLEKSIHYLFYLENSGDNVTSLFFWKQVLPSELWLSLKF